MSETHQPTDRSAETNILLEDGKALTADLIAAARALIGGERAGGLTARFLSMVLRKCIAPAEATLRRMIILLAATLKPAQPAVRPRTGTGRAPPPKPAGRQSGAPRRPVFRLTEPLPRPKTDELPTHLCPRIRLLDEAALAGAPTAEPAAPPRKPAAPVNILARIERRLAALESALADPAREARRWQRRQSRQRADKSPPQPPLAFRRIPGDGPHLSQIARDLLHYLNHAAFSALAAPDTS
ncbi:MAG: hypothetical protein ACK4MQ_03700 [Hyphomonas sp.]